MLIAVPGKVEDAVDNQPRPEVRPCPHGCQQRVSGKGRVPGSPGVILKDILDALTMVDIPVDNEDPGDRECSEVTERQSLGPWGHSPPQEDKGLDGVSQQPALPPFCRAWAPASQCTPVQPVSPLGVFGCYGHIVEHAESIGSGSLAVMPRRSVGENWVWGTSGSSCALTGPPTGGSDPGRGQLSPHQGEPVVHSPRQHGIHQLQRSPHGQPGTVEGTLWGRGANEPPLPTPHGLCPGPRRVQQAAGRVGHEHIRECGAVGQGWRQGHKSGTGMWMCSGEVACPHPQSGVSPGPHRMEIDSVVLSTQRL